jgi:hypothetical protein
MVHQALVSKHHSHSPREEVVADSHVLSPDGQWIEFNDQHGNQVLLVRATDVDRVERAKDSN